MSRLSLHALTRLIDITNPASETGPMSVPGPENRDGLRRCRVAWFWVGASAQHASNSTLRYGKNLMLFNDLSTIDLGRRLIALAESETKRLRYDEIQLYTNLKMVENTALYSSLGYVEIGRRSEQSFQRVYMSKRLTD